MSIKLDKKDVMTVADSRVFRRGLRKFYIVLVVSMAILFGGMWVAVNVHDIGGVIMVALGFVVIWGWMLLLGKQQKKERKALLKEWGEE